MQFIYLFALWKRKKKMKKNKRRIKCEYEPISLWTLIDWCAWCWLFCVIVRLFVGHIVIRDNLFKHLNFQHGSGSFIPSKCAVYVFKTLSILFLSVYQRCGVLSLFIFANLLKVWVGTLQFAFRFLFSNRFYFSLLSLINYHFPLNTKCRCAILKRWKWKWNRKHHLIKINKTIIYTKKFHFVSSFFRCFFFSSHSVRARQINLCNFRFSNHWLLLCISILFLFFCVFNCTVFILVYRPMDSF